MKNKMILATLNMVTFSRNNLHSIATKVDHGVLLASVCMILAVFYLVVSGLSKMYLSLAFSRY